MPRRSENRRATPFSAEFIKACSKWFPGPTAHFPRGPLEQPGPHSPEVRSSLTLEKLQASSHQAQGFTGATTAD